MLRKKEIFTVVTPIPGFIPRQLAISILHSHSEVITLNPLVIRHWPVAAPQDATADEFYSTWYEIEERIQYIPGTGSLGSGKISFKGCFHDMPWGLQTHIRAPLSIDLRNTYRICGNQPGYEPPEHREIGLEALGAPADGLYLREDIEIKCNITMVTFVKSQLKAASKEMVQRIIKKAQLVDAGVLKAMIEDGKLKTVNPNDRSAANQDRTAKLLRSQQGSLRQAMSPQPGRATPNLPPSYSPTHPLFAQPQQPTSPSPQPYYQQQQLMQQQQQQQQSYQGTYAAPPVPPKEDPFPAMELPGDYVYRHSSGLNNGSAQPNQKTELGNHSTAMHNGQVNNMNEALANRDYGWREAA